MDIRAKHIPADANGVRIAELDEMRYRQLLWDHQPLTDFWRIGRGYAKKLAKVGLYTMGDIARCSIGKAGEFHNEDLLYKLFGVNAEPVSYTHLDVYKRQAQRSRRCPDHESPD